MALKELEHFSKEAEILGVYPAHPARRSASRRSDDRLAQPSCAGLTRASIVYLESFSKQMDGRVKPGHDTARGGVQPQIV
jgi:hypothetical protein